MQSKAFALAATAGLFSLGAQGEVTFNRDVLPILQENCQICHRPGGANLGGMVAPMAFTTYEETRPWAKAIAKAVETRKMPPWHAAPEQHGQFDNERTLTDEHIATLVAWSKTGALRGAQTDAPAAKEWPESDGWLIGTPDLVLTPDEAFFVEDDVTDLYTYLKTTMTDEMMPEDRFIKAVEFRPGSPVVHHIITNPLGGIAPGNDPSIYPDGIGMLMKKGTDLSWEMHYHKEAGPGTGVWDKSSVAVKFYENADEVKYKMQGNDLGRYDFVIPAGEANYTLKQEYTFKHDSQIISYLPHFHLRGKAAKYEAFYPDGRSEVLLNVPKYDFNWQTTYSYKDFKKVPAGTKVVYTSVWDNSTENAYNPDPTQTVRWGEPTTDEMSYGYMSFINDSGDEEYFFDNLSGEENLDLVALVGVSDKDKDGKMSKDETLKELLPFFGMMDTNSDGLVDMEEAKVATSKFRAAQGGTL